MEENISYWSEEIEKLEIYEDKAKNVKYSETAVVDLGKKKAELEEKLKDINEIMKAIRKDLTYRAKGERNSAIRRRISAL